MNNLSQLMPCPCGSNQLLIDCCGPYLQGQRLAPTAEALMRSRYTAYCTGNIDYLIATHHPTRRSADSRQTKAIANRVIWLGLTVVETAQGQPDDTTGMVEFVARYQEGSGIAQLHERSQFVQQQGRWFYVDGQLLPPLQPKRNQPCWCGSGKKFKQCHGQS